jgi:hypothetical protein
MNRLEYSAIEQGVAINVIARALCRYFNFKDLGVQLDNAMKALQQIATQEDAAAAAGDQQVPQEHNAGEQQVETPEN